MQRNTTFLPLHHKNEEEEGEKKSSSGDSDTRSQSWWIPFHESSEDGIVTTICPFHLCLPFHACFVKRQGGDDRGDAFRRPSFCVRVSSPLSPGVCLLVDCRLIQCRAGSQNELLIWF
jgi:hypothetical protein